MAQPSKLQLLLVFVAVGCTVYVILNSLMDVWVTHMEVWTSPSKTTENHSRQSVRPGIQTAEVSKQTHHRGPDEDYFAKQRSPKNDAFNRKPNVLFIMADDLRTQISPYQDSHPSFQKLFTPNFERLAGRSLVLKSAYAQYSLCGPSRTSMLTSRRPDTTGVYSNTAYWRTVGGDFTTLPQYFKDNGYVTVGAGKIFHQGESSNNNDPVSWSEPFTEITHSEYLYVNSLKDGSYPREVSPQEESQTPLMDRVLVDFVKESLAKFADESNPFFLAVGFKKPHLSYVCPEKYFRLYEEERAPIFLSEQSWQTPIVKHGCHLRNQSPIDNHTSLLPEAALRSLRRGYFACVSYLDDLIGQVLDTMDHLNLWESTIVSFVADHGYHLGENGAFGKQTLYEISNHVPMMIYIPGKTENGVVSDSIVESVDLFPTLVQAAGLPPLPECATGASQHIGLCTEGKSFYSLVTHPREIHKTYALSQILGGPDLKRYSVRTRQYRYSDWVHTDRRAHTRKLVGGTSNHHLTELYDHETDPEESNNMANDTSYAEVTRKMRNILVSSLKLT